MSAVYCQACSYPLDSSASSCPECGRFFDAFDDDSYDRFPRLSCARRRRHAVLLGCSLWPWLSTFAVYAFYLLHRIQGLRVVDDPRSGVLTNVLYYPLVIALYLGLPASLIAVFGVALNSRDSRALEDPPRPSRRRTLLPLFWSAGIAYFIFDPLCLTTWFAD